MKTLIEKLREAREAMTLKAEELKVLSAKEDYSDEDDAKCATLKTELSELKTQIEQLSNRNANAELSGTLGKFLASHEVPNPVPIAGGAETLQGDKTEGKVLIPATYSSVRLQHIKGEKFGMKPHDRAYALGMWARGAFLRDPAGAKFCEQNGIQMLAHMEGDQAAGGWLVPEQVSTDIIDIREEFSPFRQYADVETMTTDHATFPIAKGGLKAYPVGEGQDATESQVTGDSISLTAKKWLVWATNSSELSEDAFVSWADKMSYEIGRAFAEAEADCGFLGDGTSAYHGITGIIPNLIGQDATPSNVPGLQVASGNLWSEITLNDLISLTGKVSNRTIRSGDLRFYCSQQFYTEVMTKLAMAAGGNAAAEYVSGAAQGRFLGYPVVITPAMPTAQANSQIPVLFGSIRGAVKFGDRKGISLFMTEHLYAKSDMIAWRGRERFDINVWNAGDKDAVSPDSKTGAIAGLITAAS